MFKKPLRVKSNNPVKGSEKKNLKDHFMNQFPALKEEEANSLFSKKETLNCIKAVTGQDETILIYATPKKPLIFDVRGRLFPTIFLLWDYPHLLYSYTIPPQVTSFIYSGADLMLPGVMKPPAELGLPKYGNVSQNDIVSVNVSTNSAAIAVGFAAQSSTSMELAHEKGKCVLVCHFYGDHLCKMDELNGKTPVPNLGLPKWIVTNENNESVNSSETIDTMPQTEEQNHDENKSLLSDDTDSKEVIEEQDSNTTNNTEAVMDAILWDCFLSALKYSKSITLPILVSSFYKTHMLPFCPDDTVLDIKKTSYKKLKTFLDVAAEMKIIKTKEVRSGVINITEINKDHPSIVKHYIEPEKRPKKDNTASLETKVTDSYIITRNVLPLFESEGYYRGSFIQKYEVKKVLTKFVKEHDCQHKEDLKLILPTGALKTICKTENPITWEEVMEKICDSMTSSFKVSTGNEEIINKGKLCPITMTVAVRANNKKVTLVDNLELFGVNINEFAKECQHGLGASTSITPKSSGKKCDQLLVQGNQVLFIYNALTEKYKIPKRCIRGLENAPKKKK